MVVQHFIDARRLLCPMPVIRLQDAVAGLRQGDLVEMVCTDPGVLNDVPAWCRLNGHRVRDSNVRDGEYVLIVEVGCGGADGGS